MNKTVMSVFCALVILLFSPLLRANPQTILVEMQTMRLAITNAVTSFYMFSGLDADSKYAQRIDANFERFEASLEQVSLQSAAIGLEEEVLTIEQDWTEFKQLMNNNRADMMNVGYSNVRLVDDMGRNALALVNLISSSYTELASTSGMTPPAIVQQARNMALLMEEITSQYAARGTSVLGQVFVGVQKQTLTEMADKFQRDYLALKDMAKDKRSLVILDSIGSKWSFMERSIRNYNENSVPFLVVSYNDRIVGHLQELDDSYHK
ncbi:hypothetical protein [Thalassolituus sp.]|jgi:hypothetical protein|uniref:hypothetical protein n=1 Tax=Thalassolituus sp. TaxID=2030822 RepID=UPI002A82C369|nr:hypothetical protein [Thalassolituus sp.]|tara:strand:+ start:229 stop:1023 length:795 start_codon:yes stop_codon:yes gene_type:complete